MTGNYMDTLNKGFLTFCLAILAGVYAGDATGGENNKQGPIEVQMEEQVKFGDKKPDEYLDKLIESYDTKKAEIMIIQGNLDSLFMYCAGFVDILDKYDLTKSKNKNRAAIIYNDYGARFVNKKQYMDSIRNGEKAFKLDPDNQTVVRNLALNYKDFGKKINNRKYLLKSLELYKNCIEVDKYGKFTEECGRAIKIINNKYLPNAN
jgi:tetratricopeptide (TPR) repeat protein